MTGVHASGVSQAAFPSIDIFGSGYVLHDREGWEITAAGRNFLCALEAITQDNLMAEIEPPALPAPQAAERPPGELIVVGHRFKNRLRPQREPLAGRAAFPGAREESVSKLK